MKHEYIISEVEKGLELENGSICGQGKIDPLTNIRVCIYKILTVYYSPNEVMKMLNRTRVLQYYYKRRIANINYDRELRKMFIRIKKIISYSLELYESDLNIKVIRKQQEVLYVGKKLVSIEAGQIINSDDFTFNELDSIGNFLAKSMTENCS
jgi:hypothetical protein